MGTTKQPLPCETLSSVPTQGAAPGGYLDTASVEKRAQSHGQCRDQFQEGSAVPSNPETREPTTEATVSSQGYRNLFRPCLLGGLTGSILSPDPWSVGGWGRQPTEEVGGVTNPWRR